MESVGTASTEVYETSLAVWDVPSPVLVGQTFTVKVGASSSVGRELTDAKIEIHDEAGIVMACGALEGPPWPDTSALYWTEVELVAPLKEGVASWSVQLIETDPGQPDRAAFGAFSFTAMRPSEHKVTVTVIEKTSRVLIRNGEIRLGPYRANTNESGLAEVAVAQGIYNVIAWKAGYLPSSKEIDVTGDLPLELELEALPEEEDVYSRWL